MGNAFDEDLRVKKDMRLGCQPATPMTNDAWLIAQTQGRAIQMPLAKELLSKHHEWDAFTERGDKLRPSKGSGVRLPETRPQPSPGFRTLLPDPSIFGTASLRTPTT